MNPYNHIISKGLRQAGSIDKVRQDPTPSDPTRPQTATETATSPLPDDPDFALIASAWSQLPQAIRAGILAMVKDSLE
jgi:hypothetical protein